MARSLFKGQLKLWLGGGFVLAVVLMAIFADWIAPYDPYRQNLLMRLKPPAWMEGGSTRHLLGTDNYGRDLLSRLIYGARISLLVGVSSMVLSCTIGLVAGIFAGYKGGRCEQVIMRLADAHMAFPDILLAIVMVAAMGGGAFNLILVLGISRWMIYARVIFGLTRSIKQRPFVEAAASYGAKDVYITFRHILPQLVPVLTVLAALQVAQMILQETALSFLGLGVPPPAATWGNILAEGRDRLFVAPWIANAAGLAIILLVLSVNLFGNGLRERFDPRMRQAA
ncbi:ABC transporter permease [Microvirga sp. BT689]|uniref:ABC transporter permease n=1 Tax=Microvirga arvi TaxID=2778731 RepID=UPI0019512EDA|nr:ABC transporter permease [Microvirga arvi]MBM6581190.1 ABC transporter permease [Microvirga arvi]